MSTPQIIAAVVLILTAGYHVYKAVEIVRYTLRAYGRRNIFARLRGVEFASVFVNLATALTWIALLAWGGFWS